MTEKKGLLKILIPSLVRVRESKVFLNDVMKKINKEIDKARTEEEEKIEMIRNILKKDIDEIVPLINILYDEQKTDKSSQDVLVRKWSLKIDDDAFIIQFHGESYLREQNKRKTIFLDIIKKDVISKQVKKIELEYDTKINILNNLVFKLLMERC